MIYNELWNLSRRKKMVSLKNPLNFIKKANRTFNVYLGNYNRIDSFLNSYERNQEKTKLS